MKSENEAKGLRCPFCGATSFKVTCRLGFYGKLQPTAHVSCLRCGCRGPVTRGDTARYQAVVAWNKRIP